MEGESENPLSLIFSAKNNRKLALPCILHCLIHGFRQKPKPLVPLHLNVCVGESIEQISRESSTSLCCSDAVGGVPELTHSVASFEFTALALLPTVYH